MGFFLKKNYTGYCVKNRKQKIKGGNNPNEAFQMRKSGGLGQDDSRGGGEKRLNSGKIFKVEPTGYLGR